MSNQEAQDDEIMAMASIYEEEVFESSVDENGLKGGRFSANIDLSLPFFLCCTKNGQKNLQEVKFLPPIDLFFELPKDYPSKEPPSFTLSCKWLSLKQTTQLCKKLDEIWEENKGEVVLFLWTNFLKNEALEFLNIESPLDISLTVRRHSVMVSREGTDVTCSEDDQEEEPPDKRAVQDIALQELLLPTLLDHNESQLQLEFNKQLFMCEVCLQEKLGSCCLQFHKCLHTYCKECMKNYFEVQIKDGSVQALTCPYENCESQAHPSQVKQLVDEETFARYDRLLLQLSLDTMSDVMFCPRKQCACAVLVDQDAGIGTCPSCRFVFCVYCRQSSHGVSPCKISSDDMVKLRQEYEKADATTKRQMEKRYGKRAIQNIVEESYSLDWIEANSQQCPHCNTAIQKIDGCNKMTCTKCRSFFCWLCKTLLPRNNPYSHFSSADSNCFNRLFEGVEIDQEPHFFPAGQNAHRYYPVGPNLLLDVEHDEDDPLGGPIRIRFF